MMEHPPLPQGQTIFIDPNLGNKLTVGCSWDKVDNQNLVDLDATVVLIDEIG